MKTLPQSFDYSKVDPRTSGFLKTQAEKINNLMTSAGLAYWNAGMAIIGRDASLDQIANLLSHQWGHEKDFITNAMNRVKKPCS